MFETVGDGRSEIKRLKKKTKKKTLPPPNTRTLPKKGGDGGRHRNTL